MGTQRTLKWFGYNAGQQEAKDGYDQKLTPPAGRQLLIEQIDGEQNNGTPSSWRQKYMANLENNGLAGSYGWPGGRAPGGTIRKVSLLNGTGNGSKNSVEGMQYIDAKGKIAGITLFSTDARYLQAPGGYAMYWQGKTTTFTTGRLPRLLGILSGHVFFHVQPSVPFFTTNINPRGCMDVVAGSTYPSTKAIKDQFEMALTKQGISDQSWNIVNAHSFIPSVSALAFNNPEFNWNLPANNRDLVCTNEIPFDNYFLPETNEQHITLTEKNVAWVKQEIEKGGTASCTRICPPNWPNAFCNNASYTITLDNPTNQTIVWDTPHDNVWTSSNITINRSNNSSANITVARYFTNNPFTTVTATVSNNCGADYTISKNFNIIIPAALAPTITQGTFTAGHLPVTINFGYPSPGVTYNWYVSKGPNPSLSWSGTGGSWMGTLVNGQKLSWSLDADGGACGISHNEACYKVQNNALVWDICAGNRGASLIPEELNKTTVSPNPAYNEWQFSFINKDRVPKRIMIIDALGRNVYAGAIKNPTLHLVSCATMASGLYIATIYFDSGEEQVVKITKE
jgi:hypothetical protein